MKRGDLVRLKGSGNWRKRVRRVRYNARGCQVLVDEIWYDLTEIYVPN